MKKTCNSLTKFFTNLLVISFKIIRSILSSTKSRFKCIHIINMKILPNSNSSSSFFIFLYSKTTILILISIMYLLHNKRKFFRSWIHLPSLLLCTTIKKYILLSRMTMHIYVHDHLLLSICLPYQFPHQIHLWLICLLTTSPFSIQITSISRKSIISSYHPIRIQHWHYLKQKMRT